MQAIEPDYITNLYHEQFPAGKTKVLIAAINLFAQAGYAKVSTKQIAAAAQVSEATVFKYFKTKQVLLETIVNPVIAKIPEIQSELAKAIATHSTTLAELVDFFVDNRFAFFENNHAVLKIIFQEAFINPDIQARLHELYRHIITPDAPEFATIAARVPQLQPGLTFAKLVQVILTSMISFFIQGFMLKTNLRDQLPLLKRQIIALTKVN